MYFLPKAKNVFAKILRNSYLVTGAPINILSLPYDVQVLSQTPRDFSFTDKSTTPVITTALCLVDIPKGNVSRDAGPRLTLDLINDYDAATRVPIAHYINSTNAGRMQFEGNLEVLVQIIERDNQRGGDNRDYLMGGVITTIQNITLGYTYSDPITNQEFTLHSIGENVGWQLLTEEVRQDAELVLFAGVVSFEDLNITYRN